MKRAILLATGLLALAPLLFAAPPPSNSTANSLDSQRNRGLLITRVIPDSPAQRAGLVRGDILIELGGQKVTTSNDVRQVLARHNAGDTIIAVVIHGSRTERMTIKLETRIYRPILGVEFSRSGLGPKKGSATPPGAYVDSIVPGGPAALSGIRAGDVVLAVDGAHVDSNHTLKQLIDGYAAGARISIRVRQPNGQRLTLSVQLGKAPSGGPLLGLRYSAVPTPQSGFQKFFHNFRPPKWFRYFGEPLFPNQLKGGSGGSGPAGNKSGSA